MTRIATICLVLSSLLLLASEAAAEGTQKTRVNFDELVVRGQTKKADAVYVFDRGTLTQKDLTTPRQNYRKEILETMFK